MLALWWSALLPLLRLVAGSSGDEKAEKVTRALGESVTFQVEISEPFTAITWLRIKTNDVASVAFLDPGENCAAFVPLSNFKGRLNVSGDCKRLQVKNLNQDDSGRYQAQIQLLGQEKASNLFFDLHVYKRLSESDLSIGCQGIGNGTWRLDCSAGPWEDGVKFNMALGNRREETAGGTFSIRNDFEERNPNITCAAENPVSSASKTQSVKEICTEHRPAGSTAGPDSQNEDSPPPTPLAAIVVVVVALLMVVACAVALSFWKKKKGDSVRTPASADSGGCNTIYARVGDVAEDSHHGPPRAQAAQGKPKVAQTIYTTVDHASKPNPLQTNDEKMQKGRRRAAEPKEKTIYSEIATSAPEEEEEDQSLKTVYETVKNPKPPKEQEYNRII